MSVFITTKETVERIKDIICKDIDGCVYDHHVADALGVEYSALRTAITRDKTPVKEIAEFCYAKGLVVNDLLFEEQYMEADFINIIEQK